MNTIKNIKLNELNLKEDVKDKVIFLLDNGFNVYFTEAKDWQTDEVKQHTNYFTYEKEGFFAYYQNSGSAIFPNSSSTKHLPNRKTGSGWQVFESTHITNEQLVKTWEQSKQNILSKKEQNFDLLADNLKFWNLLKVER